MSSGAESSSKEPERFPGVGSSCMYGSKMKEREDRNLQLQYYNNQEDYDNQEDNSQDDNQEDNQNEPSDDSWLRTPRFVTKTYEMINQCDPEVATWSDDGEMFIVKDQVALSSTYIPQYFGHSNFSSFDRQLNFYGFRKSFPESLRQITSTTPNSTGGNVDNTATKESAKYIRFYHEYFKRGRTDLFHLIKRTSTKKRSSSGKKNSEKNPKRKRGEVEELREEVASLECLLTGVSSQIETKFSQLSQDVDEKIAALRVIVCDANSKMFQTARHHHTTTGGEILAQQHPTRPSSASNGYALVERRFPTQDEFTRATMMPSAYDDLSLDSKPLTTVERTNPRIRRMLHEDFSTFIPPNTNFRNINSAEVINTELDLGDHFTLPASLKPAPKVTFGINASRSTTDELFNLYNTTESVDHSETTHRASSDSRTTNSFSMDGAFPMLQSGGYLHRTNTTTESHKPGEAAEPMMQIRNAKGIPRTTTEEFFGVLLEKQNSTENRRMTSYANEEDAFTNSMRTSHDSNKMTSSNNMDSGSNKNSSFPSCLDQPPNAGIIRYSTEEDFMNIINVRANASPSGSHGMHHSLHGDNFFTMQRHSSNTNPRFNVASNETHTFPFLHLNQPKKGVTRISTEEFFGVLLDPNSNIDNSNAIQGNDAATLLMLASQNLPRR